MKCPRALRGPRMKARKPKTNEPSPRDKLAAGFLKAFESDFEAHGVDVIERLREKHPDRYADLAARLIATTEPKSDGPRDRKRSPRDGFQASQKHWHIRV